MDEPKKVVAPWTDEQVRSLNDYQESEVFHPFTCGCADYSLLDATPDGWVCSLCGGRQFWAWRWMANRDWETMKVKGIHQ